MIALVGLAGKVATYARYRGIAARSEYRLRYAVGLLTECLGRAATLHDLTDESVSDWLVWLQQRYSPKTVYGLRIDLVVLWRDCAARGLCDPPGRVRRVRKPQPLPIAWTLAELRAILAACQEVHGVFRRTGAGRAAYLVALVNAAYDSGLRRSDLWELTRGQIRPDGTIVLRQRKTGVPHQPRLRPETAGIVLALPGDRPLACPVSKPTRFYRLWATVIAAARVRPGCLQQLRRSGATHLASEHPEAVQRYLGHSSPEMQRHYVDWSIARPQQWLPPEIGSLGR